MAALISLILSSIVGMYACPPNPGFTVITSTWSTSHNTFFTASAGVWGFRATEGDPPRSLILFNTRCKWSQASTCTITTPGSPLGPLVASTYSSSMTSEAY